MARDRLADRRIARPDGASIHVQFDGGRDGPWVTCLHSLATNARLWEREATWLAEAGYRVLRLDLRGHGQSTCGSGAPDIALYADDVVAVWNATGITSSVVLGLSIGGMIAIELGLSYPGRVSRVIAADCRADAPNAFRAMWDERRALLANEGREALVVATLPSWLTESTRTDRPALVATVADMIRKTSDDGYVSATHALQGLDLLPRLGRMTRPTLYIVGADDGPHPAAMAAMHEHTPGSLLTTIEGAAHLVNLEQPDAFEAAVTRFMANGLLGMTA